MVGYLEEEAVKTYTHALSDIDKGLVWKDRPAPAIGINYWKLSKDATMRELILAIRADEACHSHVNHCLSDLKVGAAHPGGGQGLLADASMGLCLFTGAYVVAPLKLAWSTLCCHMIPVPCVLCLQQVHDENPFASTNSGSLPEPKPEKSSLGPNA